MNNQRSVQTTEEVEQRTTDRSSFGYTMVVAVVLLFATGVAIYTPVS